MDSMAILIAVIAATLAAVTFHAWRLGNEKRDVALLGTLSGVCGLGAAAVAVL